MKAILDDPVTALYRRDVDRTLLWQNLRLTHEERLLKLQSAVDFAAELRRAGRTAKAKRRD